MNIIGDWKDFENLIEVANQQYAYLREAVIQKIATPWKVIRGFDKGTKKGVIYRAYPVEKSTVDFGGIARGHSIWFDAKKTSHERYIKLDNIKKHQIDFLKSVDEQGGKAFFLIYSEKEKKVWLLWIRDLLRFMEEDQRKSIPFQWLDENCKQVHSSVHVALDYLREVLA